jgi:hypothetical protein
MMLRLYQEGGIIPYLKKHGLSALGDSGEVSSGEDGGSHGCANLKSSFSPSAIRHPGESVLTSRDRQLVRNWNVSGARLSPSPVVPDDANMIRGKLLEHSDSGAIDLIVTSGGTGLASPGCDARGNPGT